MFAALGDCIKVRLLFDPLLALAAENLIRHSLQNEIWRNFNLIIVYENIRGKILNECAKIIHKNSTARL